MVEHLYLANHHALCRFLTRMLRCEEAAAEVAQEAYLRMLRYACRTPLTHPRAYLFQVAANLARTRLQQERRHSLHFNEAVLPEEVECPAEDTERAAIAKQGLEQLSQAVATLPPRCREVFLMNRLDGLSYSQIAERLGISLNMVEKHIIKALLHCRKKLHLER
ncbi:RNA polymerase sigma factor [Nitrospina watsonii]|nr:sigma-70 family RNA polymerase sigma factor [Nitrospina watsonii]